MTPVIRRLRIPAPLLLAAVVLAAAAALPFYTTAGSGNRYYFEATIRANVAGYAQLFYDIGRGFNESDSGNAPVGARAPTLVRIPIPQATFRSMRFDPHNLSAELDIRTARIVAESGRELHVFRLEDFLPLNAIQSTEIRDDTLVVRTGEDASFTLAFSTAIQLSAGASGVRRAAIPFAIGFCAVIGAYVLAGTGSAAGFGRRAVQWARLNPRKALACAATAAVTFQCNPVIFFGKSFVSPDNATLLLYEDYPVLPGYTSTGLEQAKGSDVGAMMWQHLMMPALARDALFRDGELPLWNRYTTNGVPLLGQGQSMFGDPLNWLTIFTDGEAWAWDARFVIARWLLCCGIGLAVLILTQELAPALLMTVGAGFLGYFGFRLNHPANFSVCYAPWIIVAWAGLARAAAFRSELKWCLLLVLACFCVLTSGTVKEAYMLVLCMNLAGLLVVLLESGTWATRARKAAQAAWAGVLLVLISAPILLSFISTLQRSWSIYDHAGVAQINPAMMIAFFEDLFSRQSNPGENVSMPATNFLFLAGVAWAIAGVRDIARKRTFAAIAAASVLPFAMVYGIIPGRWISSIPFLKNISHIDNTFSCSLMILTAVVAGFGLASLLRRSGKPGWMMTYFQYLMAIALLLGIYSAAAQGAPKSDFFTGYAWSLVVAVIALPAGIHIASNPRDSRLLAAIVLGSLVVICWRHAQYVDTPFNDYVFNPKIRTNLHPDSPAVMFVDSKMQEPSRPIGLGLNLFAGYNQILRWESILGVDALRNRHHHELARALGIPRVDSAASAMPEADVHRQLRGLDALNVRYYLATHSGTKRQIEGLEQLGAFDLDVFESRTAWPRAFFSDRIHVYPTVQDLADRISRGDGRPFASVEQGDEAVPAAVLSIRRDEGARTVRAARDYRLTTNTTSFVVEATGPGVIVLNENYYPDDFRATINGQPAGYFRANHSSKALHVAGAGTYEVKFQFRPHNLTLALSLLGLGLAALIATAALAFRRT